MWQEIITSYLYGIKFILKRQGRNIFPNKGMKYFLEIQTDFQIMQNTYNYLLILYNWKSK